MHPAKRFHLNRKKKKPPIIKGQINGAINDTANAPEALYALIAGTAESNNNGTMQHRDSGKNLFKFFLVSLFILKLPPYIL